MHWGVGDGGPCPQSFLLTPLLFFSLLLLCFLKGVGEFVSASGFFYSLFWVGQGRCSPHFIVNTQFVVLAFGVSVNSPVWRGLGLSRLGAAQCAWGWEGTGSSSRAFLPSASPFTPPPPSAQEPVQRAAHAHGRAAERGHREEIPGCQAGFAQHAWTSAQPQR